MQLVLPEILSGVLAAMCAVASVRLLFWIAGHFNLQDVPNERSMHKVAVPRGAGIGIVAAVAVVAIVNTVAEGAASLVFYTVILTSVAVAAIGFADDYKDLSVRLRLATHVVSAGLASAVMIQTNLIDIGVTESILVLCLLTACIVWGLNLYNFMDGIDGLALQQSVFLSASMAWMAGLADGRWGLVLMSVAVSSAVLLFWNWQPARVFIGDVGSGFIGFLLAAIGIDLALSGSVDSITILILWLSFLVDATYTLLWRLLSGQAWMSAHRSHAYQRAARALGSHSKVSAIVLGINVVWLLPWASIASAGIVPAWACLAIAAFPLLIVISAIGAGRPDTE